VIQKINFRPGIVREATEYANSGGWFEADKVRFRFGFPEKIGGWTPVTRESFAGTCRILHEWSSLENDRYVGLGTHTKLYILWGSSYYDITPVRALIGPLPNDPFEVISKNPTYLRVTVPNHGPAGPGDSVTFSGVSTVVNGFSPSELNREFLLVDVPDVDHIVIDGNKTYDDTFNPIGATGGGANVMASFQIPIGLDLAVVGTGWGVPPWGGTTKFMTAPPTGWGISFDPRTLSPIGAEVNQIRLWDMDNFGEDLVCNIRGAGIYYWHQSGGLTIPATNLNQAVTVGGVSYTPNQAPNSAAQIIVSPNDRHLIALGCDEYDPGKILARDPLLVRWSTEENAYDWEPRRDNSAGGQRLSLGSYVVCGLRTRQEILIWTDLGLWSMKYIGAPYIFGFDVIAEGLSIIGPNAAINAGNMLMWMDRGIFYAYSGQVQELPCTVRDYIFSDLNYTQQYKITAGRNHAFGEVMWFYPSAKSDEVDRYVIYNYVDQTWSIGQMQRTAWLDMGRSSYPVAADVQNHLLYYHELGDDANGEPMPAFIESADIDMNAGDHFMFLQRVLPDIEFRGTSNQQSVGITVMQRNSAQDPKQVGARFSVDPHTGQNWIRVRARQLSFRVESNALGVGWRLGTLRGDLQLDGER
jgi:hypothetical protein